MSPKAEPRISRTKAHHLGRGLCPSPKVASRKRRKRFLLSKQGQRTLKAPDSSLHSLFHKHMFSERHPGRVGVTSESTVRGRIVRHVFGTKAKGRSERP